MGRRTGLRLTREASNISYRPTAFDLVVKLDATAAVDFERMADLPVHTPTGETVPIRVLADVRREMGANMILRENVRGGLSCRVT